MLVRSLRTGLRTSIRYSRIFTAVRHQSTDATEATPEKEFKFPEVTLEYKEIFNEDLYKKLPITLENGKQIVTDLVNTIKNDTTIQSELDKIAAIPNDQTSVYSKFSSLIDVLRRARSPFVKKSGLKGRGRLLNGVDVDADLSFRTSLGRWARRDEQLANELRDLYSYLSKRVFGVEMEYSLSDARCCGIHITAHKDAQRIICSDPDIVSANLKNPLLPSEFAQQVFKREAELLKLEEYELTKFNNKKTTIESEIAKFKDGGKVEDMLWKTDKDTWKTLTDFAADDTVSEDQVNTRFPKRLSTPEGWVRYKFQAMDVVYRYS